MPVITPVVVLKLNPAGNAGLTEYEVAADPVKEGLFVAMALPAI